MLALRVASFIMILLYLNCAYSVGTIEIFSYNSIFCYLIANYVISNLQTYKNAIECKRMFFEYT
ncbi:hypothetical protein IA01_10730 [Flavobacterium psychrophilum]|nr:hypothetical protein IA01_10730 [Flavobacterium psychrophilum]AIG35334.1 hypothetical protein IA02_10110 [Flavobacterium psychrophilum]AKC22537.1 hypothetical protein IY37_10940 [Flavobacterium psychrophilum]AKC27225.1 hypothetical protein IY39_10655 [Flavobacterium psychrophilum]